MRGDLRKFETPEAFLYRVRKAIGFYTRGVELSTADELAQRTIEVSRMHSKLESPFVNYFNSTKTFLKAVKENSPDLD